MRTILPALIAALVFPVAAYGHSGGTDAYGCHAGTRPYHCHNGGDDDNVRNALIALAVGGIIWYAVDSHKKRSVRKVDTVILPSKPTGPKTDAEVKKLVMRDSISRYLGNCPCPYSIDRAGRRCGSRSAYSKPSGASPLCYDRDVTPQMVKAYRARHDLPKPTDVEKRELDDDGTEVVRGSRLD